MYYTSVSRRIPYTKIEPEITVVIHRVASIIHKCLFSTDNPFINLNEFENIQTEPTKHEDIIIESYIFDLDGIYFFYNLTLTGYTW